MKKALSLILALAMILALTACGSKDRRPQRRWRYPDGYPR